MIFISSLGVLASIFIKACKSMKIYYNVDDEKIKQILNKFFNNYSVISIHFYLPFFVEDVLTPELKKTIETLQEEFNQGLLLKELEINTKL